MAETENPGADGTAHGAQDDVLGSNSPELASDAGRVNGEASAKSVYGYESLKLLAEEHDRPVTTMVINPDTDPFYAEVPYRLARAKWFAELWQRFSVSAGHSRAPYPLRARFH
jgi:hypothetical protein